MDQRSAALALSIGARVKQQRQARRSTLDRLAEAAGVSRRSLVNSSRVRPTPSWGRCSGSHDLAGHLTRLGPDVRIARRLLAADVLVHPTPTAFGTLMALEPAIGVLLGLLVLGQDATAVQLLGIALVVLAGATAQRRGRRSSTAPRGTGTHSELDLVGSSRRYGPGDLGGSRARNNPRPDGVRQNARVRTWARWRDDGGDV